MDRRDALVSMGKVAAVVSLSKANAAELSIFPKTTQQSAAHLPKPADPDSWHILTDADDRKALAAIFDRLIPADEYGPSATETGALVFLDNQLAGDYGAGKALYLDKPLNPENEEAIMGSPQFLTTPRERYISGIRAFRNYVASTEGKDIAELEDAKLDNVLTRLEAGDITLEDGVHGQAFFELMLQNVRESYLADPIYGGNQDMAGWKMIGFPGARYDYRKYIDKRNQDLQLIPVSLVPSKQEKT